MVVLEEVLGERITMKKIDWKFKPDANSVPTADFFYDLTDGGYIRADEMLVDRTQVNEVNDAINTLWSFKSALTRAGLLELL